MFEAAHVCVNYVDHLLLMVSQGAATGSDSDHVPTNFVGMT